MPKYTSLLHNQRGIAHILLIGFFVVSVGIAGTYTLVQSQAICRIGEPCVKRPAKPKKAPRKTERQKVAEQVLHLSAQGRIRFNTTEHQSVDLAAGTTPRQNVQQAANGKKSLTTRLCAGRNGVAGRASSVMINTKILKFMRDLGQETNYLVNSVTGQCHSTSKSQHYRGNAVDIGCPFSPAQVSLANKVGKKYGIRNNTETCSADAHYHFSLGGR